jgi:hypothetical protein
MNEGFYAGDLFNSFAGQSLVGNYASHDATKTADDVSPEKTTLNWYESPVMFILTITALLLVSGWVQRKWG